MSNKVTTLFDLAIKINDSSDLDPVAKSDLIAVLRAQVEACSNGNSAPEFKNAEIAQIEEVVEVTEVGHMSPMGAFSSALAKSCRRNGEVHDFVLLSEEHVRLMARKARWSSEDAAIKWAIDRGRIVSMVGVGGLSYRVYSIPYILQKNRKELEKSENWSEFSRKFGISPASVARAMYDE